MKRVNITRDVVSRQNIATTSTQTAKPIVEPVKSEETDATSQDVQGSETNQKDEQTLPATPKRGRKTQGDKEEV